MAKSPESGQRPGETTDSIPRVNVESTREKSYQDIGQQRIDGAKNFLKNSFSSITDKLGKGLGWLAKKAEQSLAGALATPEMTVDAVKATGKGIKSAVETVGAGAIIGGGIALEAGKMAKEYVGDKYSQAKEAVITGAKEKYSNVSERANSAYESAKGAAKAAGRGAEAFGGATVDVAKATGKGIKSAVETVGAGVIIGGGIALEAGKMAKEYVGDKYSQAKEAVITGAKDRYDRVSNSARSTYESAKGAVNSAVDKFNNWRNERRMNKAAELLGVNRAQVEKLQAFLSNIS